MMHPSTEDTGREGPPSIETVYRTHFSFVWRSARRLGVQPAWLDDVTQEVFVVAARRLPEFEGRSSIRTWLFGITLRVAQSHRRWWSRQTRKANALGNEILSHPPHDPYAGADAADQLVRLLQTLPERFRQVYILGELEGMTAAEIGAGLGLNANTAYSRLREARKRMLAAVERQRREVKP